jgi:3-phenylpropionate/trans-cinnamate dioxygenase ferredoxin subunit
MFNYALLPQDQCDFIPVANIEDLPPGERLFLEIDGQNMILFNIAGHFYAIGDVCTHDEGPLGDGEVEGYEVICPRHGARFDVRSGKANLLPAVVDIPAYPVQIMDHQIAIGLPR